MKIREHSGQSGERAETAPEVDAGRTESRP
jgi:hypothetical protein